MIRYFTVIFLLSAAALAQSSSSGGNVTVSGSPAVNDCAKFVSATVITTSGGACGGGGGSGTVTSVTGTANQIDVATGTTTPVLTLSSTIVVPGTITSAAYATSGANGGITGTEGTGAGLTAASGTDLLYPDSTAHRWKVNDNNGGATTLAKFTDNLSVFAATTSAQLAGVLSDETGGSGLAVFNSSPTILTPTIADFTNANHNHTNAAGGGTLTGAALASATTGAVQVPEGTNYPFNSNASGIVEAANEMECIRWIARETFTATHFAYRPTVSAGSSTHVGFAIYSSDGTTRLMTTAAQDGTQAAKISPVSVSSFTLLQGTPYLFCWTSDAGTPATWATYGLTVTAAVFDSFWNTTAGANFVKGATASVAGAPPSSLSSLTAITATMVNVPIGLLQP